jgi:hypothetical protein
MLSSHVPGLYGPLERLRRFAIRTATSRLKSGAKTKDLWYYLVRLCPINRGLLLNLEWST